MTSAHNTYQYALKDKIREIWNYLSDDEIDAHEDMRDVFFMAVKKKHGVPRAQAEGILRSICNDNGSWCGA